MKAFYLLLLFALSSCPAGAATYYIDYSTGADTSDGKTTNTPWKRHPFMKDWSGAYSHSSGDRFVFKGGVTWPVSCFPIKIGVAGASEGQRDWYGADLSWFAGDAFHRPVFDFEDTSLGSGTGGAGVFISTSNLYWGDGLELIRHRADKVFGNFTIACYGVVNNVKLTNCIVRDWSLATPVAPGSDGGGGVGYFGGGGGSELEVDHCTFHQLNATGGVISGTAVYGFNTCKFTEIFHTASANHGVSNIHHNHIHDLLDTSDSDQHTDAIITFSSSAIYNNWIHDLVGRCAPIQLCAPSSGAKNHHDLVFNNVVYRCGVQPPLWTKVDSANYASYGLRVYNNTFEHGRGYCILIEGALPSVPFGWLDVRGNHFITSGKAIGYGSGRGLAEVRSVTNINNLTQSEAAAASAGYSALNAFAPTSRSSPTVGKGVNLSSVFTDSCNGIARTETFDCGAYQYANNGSSIGPKGIGSHSEAAKFR